MTSEGRGRVTSEGRGRMTSERVYTDRIGTRWSRSVDGFGVRWSMTVNGGAIWRHVMAEQLTLALRTPKCKHCGKLPEEHQRVTHRCPFIRDGKTCYRRQHTYSPRVSRHG